MVRAPSPEEEDRRRLTRKRGTLLKERIQHTTRGVVEGGEGGLALRRSLTKIREWIAMRCGGSAASIAR